MNEWQQQKNQRQVANWLLLGVAMIVIQVILGGITRLTESGLSITEWKPITGTLPPLNDAAWQVEFDKYRTTDQFKYVHQHFSLADFKFIFFWEWFHRVWARLLGLVFLAGFVYFLVTKKFRKGMIMPLVILFLLGALQGAIGWIMVKSGLVPEKFYVGHIELTTHFIAAMVLLCFTLWYALQLLPAFREKVVSPPLRSMLVTLLALLFAQLMYGGFMAGLKAGASAPTWPLMNGEWYPVGMNDIEPGWQNLFRNNLAIQFIHRGLAYILLFSAFYFYTRSAVYKGNGLFNRFRTGFMVMIIIQVTLGILTVVNATVPSRLVWLGVMHQFTAMLLLIILVSMLYLVRRKTVQAAI